MILYNPMLGRKISIQMNEFHRNYRPIMRSDILYYSYPYGFSQWVKLSLFEVVKGGHRF